MKTNLNRIQANASASEPASQSQNGASGARCDVRENTQPSVITAAERASTLAASLEPRCYEVEALFFMLRECVTAEGVERETVRAGIDTLTNRVCADLRADVMAAFKAAGDVLNLIERKEN